MNVFALPSAGLLDKYGFDDGNLPAKVRDWVKAQGVDDADLWHLSWHGVLEGLVREYLLPAMARQGTEVQLHIYESLHNPVRADVIRRSGQRVWGWSREPADLSRAELGLKPESVAIPWGEVTSRVRADLESQGRWRHA